MSPLRRLFGIAQRWPWLLPASSFAAGWVGFLLVHRGEEFARIVALLALSGWFWLLLEPWLRRRLEQRRRSVGNFVVNFVSQSLQQELLFFSLPLLIGATQWDAGQVVFTSLVAAAAVVSTIDPLYARLVASRAARRMTFHAFCSWIAALVVLPMVLLLPVERALPISLLAVGVWLLLTLPLSLYSLPHWRSKVAWLAGMIAVPLLFWELRGQIPAAGLAVTDARVTQTIDGLTPGVPLARFASRISQTASSHSPQFALRRVCPSKWCSNGGTTARASASPSRFRGVGRTAFERTRANRLFPPTRRGFGPSTC